MADWSKIESRGNVEDRRGYAPAVGTVSLGGLALLMIANYLMGNNPLGALNQINLTPQENNQVIDNQYSGQDSYEVFVSEVLGSNNDFWSKTLQQEGKTYDPPKLVLFRDATYSLCGNATSAVGPHYCPIDRTIYLDETFFNELTARFGAKGGDVAQAYVISHEVGHHAQNELKLFEDYQSESNNFSVKTELQADCYAGMWAGSIKDKGILEPGEISEAMDAAAAVGDDRIQKSETGYVNPETWTHGSSEQRVGWFNKGYNNPLNIETCDTFK